MEMRRRNAKTLIAAGAVITVGTDNYWASAPELARSPKVETQDHGIGTILAIEGLVELGMTPMQALVAATKNGAIRRRVPTWARWKRARSPTCWCSMPIRSPTSRTCGNCRQ